MINRDEINVEFQKNHDMSYVHIFVKFDHFQNLGNFFGYFVWTKIEVLAHH